MSYLSVNSRALKRRFGGYGRSGHLDILLLSVQKKKEEENKKTRTN